MKYDIAIIGGGPGGYTAAEKAAKAGMQVVLFEQDHLGGTCLNRGCMPTKALLHSAETYAALEHAQTLGIQTQGVSYDFAAMHRRKDQVVETLRQGVEKLMKANKITVVSGSACIQRAGVIACHGETYEAEDIVIATGSKVSYPPIPGIDLPGLRPSCARHGRTTRMCPLTSTVCGIPSPVLCRICRRSRSTPSSMSGIWKTPGGRMPELDSVQTEGAAQPLFDRTEHMPVKVGEADTLDATEPDFAPRLAKAITEAEQEGARHVELKLAPEHLGKLSVELTQGKDGVLHIVFHAENEQAMKLLQEHSATLVSMLHGSHSGEIQVEVPRPQQGEQPWQQPEQQPGQQHGRNPQEQGRQRQSTEDFLQQLRLGLLGVEAE